jgi:hypothetical protein
MQYTYWPDVFSDLDYEVPYVRTIKVKIKLHLLLCLSTMAFGSMEIRPFTFYTSDLDGD